MNTSITRQDGAVSGLAIVSAVLVLLVMVFGSVMIWALVNYNDQKNNVEAKIEVAVSQAKQDQAREDEAKFAEREKEPYDLFVGPEDLGRATFAYPKTWSSYIAETGSSYEAYFHPGAVHPLKSGKPYALRVTIESETYDKALADYESAVSKGELKSSPVTVNGFTGNRLDGTFARDIEGSMVLFKIRDKTLRLFTESPTFRNDFDKIILESFNFNP